MQHGDERRSLCQGELYEEIATPANGTESDILVSNDGVPPPIATRSAVEHTGLFGVDGRGRRRSLRPSALNRELPSASQNLRLDPADFGVVHADLFRDGLLRSACGA